MIINSQIAKKTSGGGGLLPPEYQRVEYLESTGTQYVDSGFVATEYTQIVADILVKSTTPLWYTMWGAYNTSTSKGFQSQGHGGSSISQHHFSYTTNASTNDYTGIYDKRIIQITDTSGFELRDSTSSTVLRYSKGGSHQTTISLGIFAGHETNGTNAHFLAGALLRVYNFKIYDCGTLVRDLYPCYRKADNKTGLYDIVNSVFYPNLGTGDEFAIGNLVA